MIIGSWLFKILFLETLLHFILISKVYVGCKEENKKEKKNFQIYFDFSKQNILVPFPSRYGDILERKVKVFDTQLCLTSSDPMDCSPPGSSIHGILHARILEWTAISFSRGSSQPRDLIQVSHIAGRFFLLYELPGKPMETFFQSIKQ